MSICLSAYIFRRYWDSFLLRLKDRIRRRLAFSNSANILFRSCRGTDTAETLLIPVSLGYVYICTWLLKAQACTRRSTSMTTVRDVVNRHVQTWLFMTFYQSSATPHPGGVDRWLGTIYAVAMRWFSSSFSDPQGVSNFVRDRYALCYSTHLCSSVNDSFLII